MASDKPMFCNKCGFCGTPNDDLGTHYRPNGTRCSYLAAPMPTMGDVYAFKKAEELKTLQGADHADRK